MIVLYSVAHSNPHGGVGAVTLDNISEREVALRALLPMHQKLKSAGHTLLSFRGKLEYKFRKIRQAVKQCQKTKQPWVSLALHFNQTPMEDCDQCGMQRHKGSYCVQCGNESRVNWNFGHTAVLYRNSKASLALTKEVFAGVESLIPWSKQRPLIRCPDNRYTTNVWPNTLLWPKAIPNPATLIELGYGCDRVFSNWISSKTNQESVGVSIANSIIKYSASRSTQFDVDTWHY